MGTNRMIKSRVNRFFECASVTQVHSNRATECGLNYSIPAQSRFCSGMALNRVGSTQAGKMQKLNTELLKEIAVREEIDRYRWIESEKAGFDIGIERANREWLSRYAGAWQKAHSLRK